MMALYPYNDEQLKNINLKSFPFETFHHCNGLISDNAEHSQNFILNLFPLETFQVCKGFMSDNAEQPQNIILKQYLFFTFQLFHLGQKQFFNGLLSDKDEQL